jgi:protein-S-isoprenylcysteine O-methyltransferase Ste14
MATHPQASKPATAVRASGGFGSALALVFGALSYLAFFAVFLGFLAFVENVSLPTTIDAGRTSSTLTAVLVDVGLLGLFALQHSVMARGGFKAWWTRVIPATLERSTYVLLSSVLVALVVWQWRPVTGVVWNVTNPVARWVLIGLSLVGAGIVLLSSFLVNHFDLFGLRQVYLAWRGKPYTAPPFRLVLLYRVVRHPLMLGLLILFWAAPLMTVGHLLFAGVWTIYILLSVRLLEERDLVAAFGDTYVAYRRQVPMLLPLPFRARDRK